MEWIELGKVFEFIRNGKSIKQFGDEGYPITRIETISAGYVDEDRVGYANLTNLEKYNDYLLKKGDILMSHINSVQHLAKTAIFDSDSTIIHGMNLLCLRTNNKIINSSYAYYCLNSDIFLNQIPNITKNSVNQASFNITNLKKVRIPVVPINMQKQIVEVLDQSQSLIDNRKEQIKLLDDLIKSIFYDMFGDPVRNNKGWEVKELGEIVDRDIQNGLYKPNTDYTLDTEKGIPIIRIDGFYDGKITEKNHKRVICDDEEIQKYSVEIGDILINRVNSLPYLGKSAYVDKITEKTVFESNMMKFKIKNNELNNNYFIYLLNTQFIKNQILGRAKKSVNQASINQKDVKSFKVNIPPTELQNQFAEKVELIESQKQLLEDSLRLLEDNYNGLMQRAFKGELFN